MVEARNEDSKLFKIIFMKDPDYVMKVMASWMTIYEQREQGQEDISQTAVGQRRRSSSHTGRHLGLILDKDIKWNTIIIIYMRQIPQIGHGRPSYSLIATLPCILWCQQLIHILRYITFKMIRQCNQVWIFGEIFQYSALRIQLGLNWEIMDDLRELLNYLFMSLVIKLQ